MADWWEAAPLAPQNGAPPPGGNWWEAAPLADEGLPPPSNDRKVPLTLEQRIMQGYRNLAGNPTEQAAPAANDRSLVDRIMSGFDYAGHTAAIGVRELRRGAANVVGLPVDAVNASPRLLNLLPGEQGFTAMSPKPFMGSQFIDEALSGFGAVLEPTPPQDAFQRTVGRVSQELGAAAVPVGSALGAARALGVEGARAAPSLVRMFVEPAAVDAAKFVGKEAAAATAAGVGASGVNEVTRLAGVDPNSTTGRVGDVVGALAGAGSFGGGMALGRKVGEIVSAVTGASKYADNVVRQAVTDRILQEAGMTAPKGKAVNSDPLVAQIMGGPRVGAKVPGFQESLADRTGNSGIAALEYGRQSGPSSGLYTQRKAENTAAIDTAVSKSAPDGTPGALREEMESERDRRLVDASTRARDASAAAVGDLQPLQPSMPPATRGNIVRSTLEEARAAARQRTADQYDAVDLSGVTADPSHLAEGLDAVTTSLTPVERGLAPQGMIDSVAQLGRRAAAEDGVEAAAVEPISLKVATDLESELKRMQRAALADPRAERGGRNAARVIGRYLDQVTSYIDSNLSPEQAASLADARSAKYDEAQAFTRAGDPVASVLARHEGGNPRIIDERVAGQFVRPQALDTLLYHTDTPEVRTAIRDEVLSRADMRTAEGIARFTQDYGEQLQRFPGLQDQLERAARSRAEEVSAATAETDLMREIGKDGRGVVAKYLQFGDENADRAMKSVLASRDPAKSIDELLTFVNDNPQAVEGARKVFWDLMQKQSRSAGEATATVSGTQPWMPRRLKTFLDDPRNAAVAARLWRENPEHLENVREIADAIQNVDIRNRARATNSSGTAQGFNALLSPEGLQSRYYAMKSGRISLAYFFASLGSVIGRRAVRGARASAIERTLDEALLNPDLAALLIKENNPANRAALARRAKGWIGNEASTLINLMNDAQQDPVVRAVKQSD